MRAACQLAISVYHIDFASISLKFLPTRVGQEWGSHCRAGRFCRPFNHALTIMARGSAHGSRRPAAPEGKIMRIYGPNGTSVVANTPQTRRTGSQAFTLDRSE